jgi:small-conductance mechanosensitive channel
MFTSERTINSRIDLKKQKSLDSTKERLFSQTTFFIRILSSSTQTNTHTHTHVSRFFSNEKRQLTKSIWNEEFKLFVFQKFATSFSTSIRHLKNDYRKWSFLKRYKLKIKNLFHDITFFNKLVIGHNRIPRNKWRRFQILFLMKFLYFVFDEHFN